MGRLACRLGGAALLFAVTPLLADEAGPAPATLAWSAPIGFVLPLPELFDRGLVATSGVKPEFGLTVYKVSTGERVFSAPLPDEVACANVAGDVLVLGTAKNAHAFSLTDGKLLWQQPVKPWLDAGWATAALNWWKLGYPWRLNQTPGVGGGPLVLGGRLYLAVNGVVYAVEPATGKVLWQQRIDSSLCVPMMACGNRLILSTLFRGLAALSADDGHVLWSGAPGVLDLAAPDGELYGATMKPSSQFYRFDPDTGKVLWQTTLTAEQSTPMWSLGDRLVVVQVDDTTVFAKADGKVLWRAGTRRACVRAANGVLACIPNGGGLIGLDTATAQPKWQATAQDSNLTSVALHGSTLVGLAPGGVYGWDLATGEAHWAQPYTAGPGGALDPWHSAADGDTVYLAAAGGVAGFDLRTGAVKVLGRSPLEPSYGLWRVGDRLLVHTGAGGKLTLKAFALPAK